MNTDRVRQSGRQPESATGSAGDISSDGCPDSGRLSAYLCGKISDHEARLIEDHVEQCRSCEKILDTIADDDTLLRPLFGTEQTQAWLPSELPELLQKAKISQAKEPPPRRLGQYEVLHCLGGNMGEVYLVKHLRLSKRFVLKLLPRSIRHQALAERFEREMLILGKLNDPHVVGATDAGEEDGVPYLVMPYVDGIDLSKLVQRRGPLPVAESCELIRQAAIGLAAIHREHIVHRDVKPGNLMLDSTGMTKVVDLGLARLNTESSADGSLDDELTLSGAWLGTVEYMAPEQQSDARAVTESADVYSLGCTLFKLLTGYSPFSNENVRRPAADILWDHRHTPPPDVRRFRPDLSAELASLISAMLAKEPKERPKDMKTVAQMLQPSAVAASRQDLQSLLDEGAQQSSADTTIDQLHESIRNDNGTVSKSKSVGQDSSGQPKSVVLWTTAALLSFAVAGAAVWISVRDGSLPSANVPPVPKPAPKTKPDLPFGEPQIFAGPLLNPERPNQPVELLDFEPIPAWWPGGQGLSKWRMENEGLFIQCHGGGLLQLGQVYDRNYTVQMRIRQTGIGTGIGGFFGMRESIYMEQPAWQYQVFEVRQHPKYDDILTRMLVFMVLNSNGQWHSHSEQLAYEPIRRHLQFETLEFRIVDGRLRAVYWNNDLLPKLFDSNIDNRLIAADSYGRFGISTRDTACVVHDAEISFQSSTTVVGQQP